MADLRELVDITDDDREMLILAAHTYRGFSSQGDIGSVIRSALGDRWELAWGPATFAALGSLFDDAMMFVAKERNANRYASPTMSSFAPSRVCARSSDGAPTWECSNCWSERSVSVAASDRVSA